MWDRSPYMAGNSAWEEIDVVRDVDGIVAVITRHRKRRQKWAIAAFVEFVRPEDQARWAAATPEDREKLVERTIWIDDHLTTTVQKVLSLAHDRVTALKKQAMDVMSLAANRNAKNPPPR